MAIIDVGLYDKTMSIATLISLCVVLGLVWLLGKIWWRLPMPQFSKIMLTSSLLLVLPGMILVWNNSAELGTALMSVAGVLSGIESYVRRKKDKTTQEQ